MRVPRMKCRCHCQDNDCEWQRPRLPDTGEQRVHGWHLRRGGRGVRVKQAFSLFSIGAHRLKARVTLPVAAGWWRGESGLSRAEWRGSFAP